MPIPAPLLNGRLRDYMIGHLMDLQVTEPIDATERQLLGLSLPPWQRPEVWTVQQKVRFIEGIFLGLGCGYYVINGSEWAADAQPLPMSGWLIDGQQRISALRDFIQGDLVVFGDVQYASLSQPEKMRFKRIKFACFALDYIASELVLMELYDRLNFGGTAHTQVDREQFTNAKMERQHG